jgi:predicted O-methyltransferase YrrM
MTTRDTTSLLARSDEGATTGVGRSWRDRLTVFAFAVIQWPWLLRSLHGGRRRDKYALLDRLRLPHDSLPNLGSWKADVGLLRMIVDHIIEHRPQVMVEFGTGASTLVAARALQMAGGGRLTSFDQHGDFVEATRQWLAEYGLQVDLRAAALGLSPGGWPGLWYRPGKLPNRIDFMLVDGPPWTIHPLTRGAADSLFDRIPIGGTVMLDDGARPGERIVARRWRKRWPGFEFKLVNSGTKGTLVGVRYR